MFSSLKTTLSGLATGATIIVGVSVVIFALTKWSGDPTEFPKDIIIFGVGLLGLGGATTAIGFVASRDNTVSSEDVGIKRRR